jgi:hypothetical protein
MPDKKTDFSKGVSSDRDELAELLLFVWLQSEVKDVCDLPLRIQQ